MNCTITGCDSPHLARGWCKKHYEKWRAHGDPMAGNTYYATPEAAFAARTVRDEASGCLIWTGAKDRHGYGVISVNGKTQKVHRYTWERAHGPIPDGSVIDHKCHTPACCERTHLRDATRSQNSMNRSGAQRNNILGLRGVYSVRDGFKARVDFGGKVLINPQIHPTAQAASETAAAMRAEHFGAFQGRN